MITIIKPAVRCFFTSYCKHITKDKSVKDEITKLCNTIEFVQQKGYPVEKHEVLTDDGYILELHRIPFGRQGSNGKSNTYPVFLQHGLWSSSSDWIVSGPANSFGLLLADSGYDVWLGNSRGNMYSRKHISLNIEKQSERFWNFSFHEMGHYDLPAAIDYILKNVGVSKLFYVGHSQGTTIFFVMTSTRPEYNNKIISMVGLAPVAYLTNIRSSIVRNLSLISDPILSLTKVSGFYKLLPEAWLLKVLQEISNRKSEILEKWIINIFGTVTSYACEEVRKNILPIAMSHFSTGASFKQLAHYAQLCRREFCFRQFDYGQSTNIHIYAQSEPPDYNLKNITCPVKVFYSENDWLAHPKDVEALYKELPNKVGLHKVLVPSFNHLDFLWSLNAKSLIFIPVIESFHKMSKKSKINFTSHGE